MRQRFLRQAFKLYKNGVDELKKAEKDEQRCQLYWRTRDERLKQTVYNTWHIYKTNHVRAKKYWNRIYLRLDLSMKQRALKMWKESAYKISE
jgi:hypothetical protein